MSLREAVEPLLEAFALDLAERNGRLTALPRDGGPTGVLSADDLVLPEASAPERRARSVPETPSGGRARFIDDAGEYQLASAAVPADGAGRGGPLQFDLPVIASRGLVERAVRRRLARVRAEAQAVTIQLSPSSGLSLEPGDRVRLNGGDELWRVGEVSLDEAPKANLVLAEVLSPGSPAPQDWRVGEAARPPAPPVLHLLDLPALPGAALDEQADHRPVAAAAGEPWRGAEILAGPARTSLTLRGRAEAPAGVGLTVGALRPAPADRLHVAGRLTVVMEGAELQSRAWLEVAAGANALAVLHSDGEWEVLQFRRAELVGPDTYDLHGLLRGQLKTEGAAARTVPAGAPVVALEGGLVRVDVAAAERGAPLVWRAAPPGAAGGLSATETVFVWRDLASRPWSPAHLRGRRAADGGLSLGWIRRGRAGGDSWEGEPPLGEAAERYRVAISEGERRVRAWETASPNAFYTAEQIAADFPAGRPSWVTVEVSQGSASFGWGTPARRDLWL